MPTLKSVYRLIVVLVPVVYCGWLLYYFLNLSGSVQEAVAEGLGPTLVGLAAVGVLFLILFIVMIVVMIVRIFAGPRSPGSGGRGGPDASTPDDEGGFDADAVLARYMARRSAEAAPGSPAAPPAPEGGGPARRPSFGRKIR
jgi:hypothetical protein